MSTDQHPSPGAHTPLGATPQPGGVNFAVHAPDATDVWVCLIDDDGAEQRLRLPAQTAGIHHGFVAGIGEGAQYCLRAAGPWEPEHGRRFNEHKALIDPYARRISGPLGDAAALLPHDADGAPSKVDSLPDIPRSVVTGTPTPPEAGPRVPWDRTVICEVHVGSYTARHPGVPEELRGTYLGLAQPAVLDHLRRIGVTALELLPVQACLTEPGVRARGMRNHWGYSTGAYFAPDPRFAAEPGREVEEFAAMVSAVHAAGLEVLLDVVYNHTAESSADGPSLSWRGLDAPGYYLLDSGEDLDYTGCGNTVDCASPPALRMVLDSLRYWSESLGVDGFRFDLASVLGRGRTATGPQGPAIPFDHRAPLLSAIAADPVLATRKLIAEPWDATGEGYRVGGFPPVWAEWNDRYRDTVRAFFAGGATVGDLASRVSGSQDLFGAPGRTPFSSINFVTAHDGFTARDLVSYERKHNEANGENDRDGTDNNHSVNHGFEGGTTDPVILAARARHVRALLATLLLSTGTPMLLGGDEMGHTQYGNNNAYCVPEDAAAGDAYALDWDSADTDLTAFVTRAAAVRRATPVLRQHEFFDGRLTRSGEPDLAWFGADGAQMSGDAWQSPDVRTLQAWVDGSDVRSPSHDRAIPDKDALIVWHSGDETTTVTLGAPASCAHGWELVVDSTQPTGEPSGESRFGARAEVTLTGPTVLVFQEA
ncbi:glycogen debranching protein GlgX [Tsukamurella strandjordii]|uniref:Glycogen debranching protein GlgX n=1 Tax=Tsukamurella strandjordii TaxID=147577 RepID=A0AA90SMB0_9ACTN|nr:glycogen debranching protein GlgX [Tsukamurella strandjordii]MDP0399127.1 glycogen debranching protein GlgX [Tsukamurella strandjordii]